MEHPKDKGDRTTLAVMAVLLMAGCATAPAPRAALENFPQDVPLRGPPPLEDQLPS